MSGFGAVKKYPVKVIQPANNASLINQDSGNVEYYTPVRFINSARKVMGVIDLDPASCEAANKSIMALNIFTKDDDGLSKPWFGKVWMNHPFSKGEYPCKKYKSKAKKGEYNCKKKNCKDRGYHIDHKLPSNSEWVNKIISEYYRGGIDEAIMICFASTSETWFNPLLNHVQCFIKGRVNYFDENGNEIVGVTKGSVITYLGVNKEAFIEEFSQYGVCK